VVWRFAGVPAGPGRLEYCVRRTEYPVTLGNLTSGPLSPTTILGVGTGDGKGRRHILRTRSVLPVVLGFYNRRLPFETEYFVGR